MKVTAAVLREIDAPLEIEDLELDALAEGEVLVRMKGVGICHTDISAQQGVIPLPTPTVLGHEGSGIVEAIGEGVTRLAVGDHVALSFDHCGECQLCLEGRPGYCEMFAAMNYFGTRPDGTVTLGCRAGDDVHGSWFGQSSFASHAIASERNAVRIPKTLPVELAGPLGCGLQTGAGAVINCLQPKPGEGIAVFGMGAVGLAAVMAAKALECSPIIALDLNPDRLALALELGATHTFNPSEHHDLAWDLQMLCAPGVHHSLDAVGHPTVIRQALEVLRSPGQCVTVGFGGLEQEITIDQGHLLLGRTLRGVIEGDASPQHFIPKLIELHAAGKFPFERLITTYPLDRINDAIADSASGAAIKPVIVFDEVA
jgi:aryl-alcohol dehydrogenase